MNEIIFVFCDDWQAIYVNGELKIEKQTPRYLPRETCAV